MTDIHRCPICNRCFLDYRALSDHGALTTKHENIFTYVRRLQFLLAEAEDNVAFWRDARREAAE
jgi:hypothetical protein